MRDRTLMAIDWCWWCGRSKGLREIGVEIETLRVAVRVHGVYVDRMVYVGRVSWMQGPSRGEWGGLDARALPQTVKHDVARGVCAVIIDKPRVWVDGATRGGEIDFTPCASTRT